MGCSQRRIGPLNLGWYGILATLINGCNLIISQFLIPKVIVFGFQIFIIFFFLYSFYNYLILYPYYLLDIYNSIILILLLIGICILFINFSAFSSYSKYSILGSIRIISQFISFELIFTTILLIFIWSWNDLSITSMWFTGYIYFNSLNLYSCIYINYLILLIILFNLVFLLFFFTSIMGESNRVPFDLTEAESELVAGLITEYSSIYFSIILLTEYGSIVFMLFWMITLFSIIIWSFILFMIITCFLRSTLNRLKFDELMTNAWILILAILFPIIIFLLHYYWTL